MARRRHDVDIGINTKDNSSQNVAKVQSRFQKLTTFLKTNYLAVIGAVTAATAALGVVFGKSVSAADDYADALKLVESALERSGELTAANLKVQEDFAANLQDTANVAATTGLEMLALAQSYGFTADESRRALAAAVDFGKASKLTIEEALRRIGRGAGGATGDLANFATSLRDVAPDAVNLEVVLDALNEKFEGTAAAAADTSKGIREGLVLALADLSIALGETLTESEAVNDAMTELRDLAKDPATAQGFVDIANGVIKLGGALKTLVEVQKQAPDVKLLGYLTSLAKRVFDSFKATESLAGEVAKMGTVALPKWNAELEKLNKAKERSLRIDKEWEAQLKKVNAFASELGVTLDNEVNAQIEEYEKKLLIAQDAERKGIIQREEVIRLEEGLARKKEELNAQLRDEVDATDEATEALTGYADSAREATAEVIQLRQETDAAAASARDAAGEFSQNLLGGQSEFAQVSGGTFFNPQPQVKTDRFGRVIP